MEFDEFVETNLPALVRYAAVLAGDRELAEDIVQDVLIRVHARWRRIRAMALPAHYVQRMVTREYLSWHRTSARRRALLARSAPLIAADLVDDHAERTAISTTLTERLAALPPHHRAVLVLGYYQGHDDAEIASLLGCAPGSVRVFRSRALAALRDVLDETPREKQGAQRTGGAA